MQEEHKEKKNLFKNIVWLFGGGTASSVFTTLETIVLARMLGLENFGLFSLVVAYVRLLNRFFDFRVWETAVKYVGDYWERGEGDKACSMIKFSYIVDISSGILAFFISILLAKFANDLFIRSSEGFAFIVIYSISLLISTANTTSEAILRVFDKFKNIAFINSFQSFIRLSFVLISLVAGYGVKGVLFAYVATSIFGFVLRQLVVWKLLIDNNLNRWTSAKLVLIKEKLKEISYFMLNTNLIGTLKMANEGHLAILVLGYFAGKEASGLYKVARAVVKVMYRFSGPVNQAIYPNLVRLYNQKSLEKFVSLITYSLKTLMKFTVPVATICIVFTGFIINIFFGEQYLPATNAMRVIVLAVVIAQLTFWVGPALLAIGKPEKRSILEIMNTIFYAVVLVLLVSKFSLIGAAFAILLSSILKSILSYYIFDKTVKTTF